MTPYRRDQLLDALGLGLRAALLLFLLAVVLHHLGVW